MSWGWVVSNPALLRPEHSGPGMISPTKHQKTLTTSVNWKYFMSPSTTFSIRIDATNQKNSTYLVYKMYILFWSKHVYFLWEDEDF